MSRELSRIDAALVRRMIAAQFPQWKDLPIRPVEEGGFDHRMFHLGEDLLVRLPSAEQYAGMVEKEQKWLPFLAKKLPLSIPEPVALGKPFEGYPWNWSVYRYLEGASAAAMPIGDLEAFAIDLAAFFKALWRIDPQGGPLSGAHNFYRGGSPAVYDKETRSAIAKLNQKIDAKRTLVIWEEGISSFWENPLVWVHGDISVGNLLVKNGNLSAVIDWGGLCIGDPACDLAMYWTFFHGKSREVFRKALSLDEKTWKRARAWVLWKALIVASGFTNPNNTESEQCWRIIEDVMAF